ncbi:SIR2 family protein [Falsiroseomonas sp. HW251]|uniref:SIR2 family protein n=1 Tax=Falsiroseomonas sp. HW251 TaxID=3390998 RepID=UPI003D321AB5
MTSPVGDFDPASSILFLGSGFSMSATNIAGNHPPNGAQLRKHFLDELKLPPESTYDLQVLSEEYAEKDSKKLRGHLYSIFRTNALHESQKTVLREPWRRIYTTNYDDIVEVYRISKKEPPHSYDVSDKLPPKLPNGAVIHLHGSIRLVTEENVRSSLILSETSYINQYMVKSPWYDQFQRDLAYASALYIIGYSLSDYHIAALLMKDPGLAKRTYFIQGTTPDSIFVRRTADYGTALFIGTEGFSDYIRSAPRPASPPDLYSLKSFRSLDPTRDRRAIAQPTASEIYDLLVYGDFDAGRLARSQPSEDYAIARSVVVQTAADSLERKASLVIDGRLGNGKTVFLHLLAFELSKRGWKCFLFRPGHPDVSKEIAVLSGVGKIVIFVENYPSAQDALGGLRSALPDMKLVVEVRTGTFEVRFHELAQVLPQPFDRVSLNALSTPEMSAFSQLCKRAGLPIPQNATTKHAELRDLLLDLFENKSIKSRIRTALAPLFDSHRNRRTLSIMMLIAAHQGTVGSGFIRSVIGADPFVALKPLEDLAKEIFSVSSEQFRVRSAVFSSFVLQSFLESEEIAAAIVDIILASSDRKSERVYRVLMSNMMAYSSLRQILRDKGDYQSIIIDIYEKIRHDQRVNDEPLFWLQYAIAMAEVPRLDAAEDYIETAYVKAAALVAFQTFQIDTQAFRISLLRATAEQSGRSISNIDKIISGFERINSMLVESSNRSYAVRVLDHIPPFISARRFDLSSSERTATQYWLYKIINSLEDLPAEFKAVVGSDVMRQRVQAAVSSLV